MNNLLKKELAKVYIVQEMPGRNIIPASEFGELYTLIGDPRTQMIVNNDWIIDILHEKLSNFCSLDYILPIGDPAIIGAAIAIASHYNNGIIQILKWDRQERKYYSVKLDLFKN